MSFGDFDDDDDLDELEATEQLFQLELKFTGRLERTELKSVPVIGDDGTILKWVTVRVEVREGMTQADIDEMWRLTILSIQEMGGT